MNSNHDLPFGIRDLDSAIVLDASRGLRVRCYVRGCAHLLRPPGGGRPGDVCPVHGIRCHRSRFGVTYSYADARRNIIAAPELLGGRVVGHPFKYDSKQFGLENSEDALTWNVFRSLQEAGRLGDVARFITGLDHAEEPCLYLWGLCLANDALEPWPLLVAARRRFESRLPVDRPKTEPDIALHLPGRYLILIEAKFTSPNPVYKIGPRRDPQSLTLGELLDVYADESLRILDFEKAKTVERVHYQLWRNMVFSEWMANADGSGARGYHTNLTRMGCEEDACAEFRRLVRREFADHFVHIRWEDIHRLAAGRQGLGRMREYLENKTAGLLPAFRFDDHELVQEVLRR
jgi:hypothetical protein